MPIETTPPPISAMGAHLIGDNWIAIIVAAIAIYMIGAIIYGAGSKIWLQLTGYTREQLKPHMWKMGISPVMPILTALGLAMVLKLAQPANLTSALLVGAQLWLFLMLPVRLYNFVYSPEKPGIAVMDAVHTLLGTLAGTAVIALWP